MNGPIQLVWHSPSLQIPEIPHLFEKMSLTPLIHSWACEPSSERIHSNTSWIKKGHLKEYLVLWEKCSCLSPFFDTWLFEYFHEVKTCILWHSKTQPKKKISDLPLGPVYVWRYGAPLGCASKGKGSGWPGRLLVTFSCRGSRQSLIHRNKMVDLRSGKGQTRTCRSVPASDFRESFPSRFNRDVKGVFIRRELLPAHVLFGFVSSSHDTYHLTAAFILPNHPSKLK